MTLGTVADLPERIDAIPRLPDEVKRLIWLFDAHPVADMVRKLTFRYDEVPYEPLSLYLVVNGDCVRTFVHQNRRYFMDPPLRRVFWLCRSIYNPDYSELPDWVVRSFDSTDE